MVIKLEPRRREKLGDRLYGQILEQIVSGALQEGDKLPSEHQICQLFEVSRPTVREALMRLHADGLVTTRQGSGTFVQKRPSGHLTRLANISDIAGMLRSLEVRSALEGQAASLAAQRRTPEQMGVIVKALAALKAAFAGSDIPARADFAFHRAVADASGNLLFADLLDMLHQPIEHAMTVDCFDDLRTVADQVLQKAHDLSPVSRCVPIMNGNRSALVFKQKPGSAGDERGQIR